MTPTPALPFSKLRLAKGLAFLQRIGATLATAGLGLDDVVQVAVHLVDGADFAAFNAEYRRHFQDPLPVRTTVVASLLAPGARLEITVTAAQRD